MSYLYEEKNWGWSVGMAGWPLQWAAWGKGGREQWAWKVRRLKKTGERWFSTVDPEDIIYLSVWPGLSWMAAICPSFGVFLLQTLLWGLNTVLVEDDLAAFNRECKMLNKIYLYFISEFSPGMILDYIRDLDSLSFFVLLSKTLILMGWDVTSALTSMFWAEGWRRRLKDGQRIHATSPKAWISSVSQYFAHIPLAGI